MGHNGGRVAPAPGGSVVPVNGRRPLEWLSWPVPSTRPSARRLLRENRPVLHRRPRSPVAVGLSKVYGVGDAAVTALDEVSVEFARGRLTALMGPSGSGKSTLMHCMAALDSPTSGRIIIDGVEISGLKDSGLTKLRRDRLGFVFQAYNLVPTMTARENITLPVDIAGSGLSI